MNQHFVQEIVVFFDVQILDGVSAPVVVRNRSVAEGTVILSIDRYGLFTHLDSSLVVAMTQK